MHSLWQLKNVLGPARRSLVLSVGLSLLIAGLWAVCLSLSFPIVQVLFKGVSFPDYVRSEMIQSEADRQQLSADLDRLERDLAAARDAGELNTSPQVMRLLHDQSRVQGKLSRVGWQLFYHGWLTRWVLPVVPTDPFTFFAATLGLLFAATFVRSCVEFLQDVIVGGGVQMVLVMLRQRLFRHCLKLDWQTLSLTGSSELMTRFTTDLEQIGTGLTLICGKLLVEPLKIVSCLAAALVVNWRLTCVSCIVVPVGALILQRFNKQLKRATKQHLNSYERLYGLVDETLAGFRTVSAFGNLRWHRQLYHQENRRYLTEILKIWRLVAITGPTTELLATVGIVLALLPGAYLVLNQQTTIAGIALTAAPMEIGELALLYALLGGILDPLRKLSGAGAHLRRTAVSTDRLFAVLALQSLVHDSAKSPLRMLATEPTAPTASNPVSSRSSTVPPPRIEFDRVGFRYAAEPGQPDRGLALDGLAVTIEPGEVVAVLGTNGSGKSTLVNLLPRLCDPTSGAIRLDGHDLRDSSLIDLRSQIGIVTQETQLFDTSLWENIRFGRPHATNAEIEAAATEAFVTTFAHHLSAGLQTMVGEKGQRLSGGQRQRVALARALVRNPRVLIMDEATSAIDSQSEQLIFRSIASRAAERTTLIVTHCLTAELQKIVTRVIYLERGRLVATGSHAQLLLTCPGYSRLFAAQQTQRAA